MLTIREYTLPKSGAVTLELPGGADVISIVSYEGALRLYVMVEPQNEDIERCFLVLKTNEAVDHPHDCLYPHGSALVDGVMRHVVEVV